MAVGFDAHADRLLNTSGSVPANNAAYTVTLWVKPQTGASGNPESLFYSSGSGSAYALALNSGVPTILDVGGGFVSRVTLGSALSDGTWYFLAMRINGLTGTLSRGQENLAVSHASNTITAQSASFQIAVGGSLFGTAMYPRAHMAFVRVWNAILSDAEIEAERQATSASRTANLTAEWPLVDAASKLTDVGPNGYSLTAPGVGPWSSEADPAPLSGAVTGSFSTSASTSADLTTGIALAAAPVATATLAASLSTAISLEGMLAVEATGFVTFFTEINGAASVSAALSGYMVSDGAARWCRIEDALRTWVKAASAYPDARVIWADQTGTRPAGDIITLKISDISMVGLMDEVTENTDLSRPAGKEIEMRADGIREFTVTLQAFTSAVTCVSAGTAILGRCQTALGLSSVRSALSAAGCSPFDVGPVQNVTALNHALFEGRAMLRVRFYTRESLSDYVGYIATVNNTSYLGPPDLGARSTIDI